MELNSREYHVKVLIIGDPLVGKTNFITSFIDYNTSFETLCGQNNLVQVSYTSKTLTKLISRPDETFKYHLWEITDYDENRDIIRLYIENTQIIIMCFSLKNPDSLDSLKYWLIEKKSNVRYVLVGLKAGINNKISQDEINNFCKTFKLIYFEFKEIKSTIPSSILNPFTHYLNDIYPKVNIIITRENTSMLNNIINYCMIL